MTEVARVVIGGVALAALFDSCMSTLARVDAGKNCGKEYQEAALSIALLGNRLQRWEQSYATGELCTKPRVATWPSPLDSLLRACKTAEGYEARDSFTDISSITEIVQVLTLGKVKKTPSAKVVWALRNKEKVDAIVSRIRIRIEDLENLSKAVMPINKHLAEKEAAEIILPPSIEEPEEAMSIVKALASRNDPVLDRAMALVATKSCHRYQDVFTGKKARSHLGNIVADGYTGNFMNNEHSCVGVRTEGEARSHYGNLYGASGKSIFDD